MSTDSATNFSAANAISWGGKVEKCNVEEVRLGCTASYAAEMWEKKIEEVVEEHDAVMFHGWQQGERWQGGGRLGKDTFQAGPQDGGMYLGEGATVWGGELAGIAEALERGPRGRGILILADSMAAIQAIKKAGKTGKARSRELVRVMRQMRMREDPDGLG